MQIRVAVARLGFTTNSFNPVITTAADSDASAGSRSEVMRLVAGSRDRGIDADVPILLSVTARPGGFLDDAAWTDRRDELCDALGLCDFDAVLLMLDGCTRTPGNDAPEFELLQTVRGLIGERPLGVVFGHRANICAELPALVDIAVAARASSPAHNPQAAVHTVMEELRRRCAGSARLQYALGQTPFTLAAAAVDAMEAALDELETASTPLDCIFTGFPYSDVRDACARVLSWANSKEEAQARVRSLGSLLVGRRGTFRLALPGPHLALRKAIAEIARGRDRRVLVTDPADAPEYGGGCDSTGLLRALLDLRPENVRAGFAYLADSTALEAAFVAGVGNTAEVSLGARHSREYGASSHLRVRVERLTNDAGPFGRSALVAAGTVRIALAERTAILQSAHDLAQFSPDLSRMDLLVLKAGMRLTPSLAATASAVIPCDTPGPAALDLASLPMQNLRAR